MFERFTDRARRVVVLAQEEARLLSHGYIGTEHLLLGLIHEGEGVAAQALESMGISLVAVRKQVEDIIGQGEADPTGHIPFTPRAKKVLELSLREALQLGHNYIGTEHILLGLIREGEGVAAQVLRHLGAEMDQTRDRVLAQLEGYAGAWHEATSAEAIAGGGPSLPGLRWRVVRALDRLGDLEAQVKAVRGDLVEIRRMLSMFRPEAPPASHVGRVEGPETEPGPEADAGETEGGESASPS